MKIHPFSRDRVHDMVVEDVCDAIEGLWRDLMDQAECVMPGYTDYMNIVEMRAGVFTSVRIMAEQVRETMGIHPNMGLTQRSARYETI